MRSIARKLSLTPLDAVSIGFLLFLIVLNFLFFASLPLWYVLAGVNMGIIALILIKVSSISPRRRVC